jgi:hypothetical protein
MVSFPGADKTTGKIEMKRKEPGDAPKLKLTDQMPIHK